jgi:hypothetical protein
LSKARPTVHQKVKLSGSNSPSLAAIRIILPGDTPLLAAGWFIPIKRFYSLDAEKSDANISAISVNIIYG